MSTPKDCRAHPVKESRANPILDRSCNIHMLTETDCKTPVEERLGPIPQGPPLIESEHKLVDETLADLDKLDRQENAAIAEFQNLPD
jgi:hypothetical protein